MAEHKHGTMDITDHEKTFEGFIRVLTWSGVVIVATLIFLAFVGA